MIDWSLTMKPLRKLMATFAVALSFVSSGQYFAFESNYPKENSNVEIFMKTQRNHLGDLLVKRFSLVQKIAEHKWNLKRPIENQSAETLYFGELLQVSKDLDLPSSLVKNFYDAQIDAQKAVEIQLFEKWVQEDIHTHNTNTNINELEQELKEVDIQLLQNLENTKALISTQNNHDVKELATQLKDQGVPRHVIDDSLHFLKNNPKAE